MMQVVLAVPILNAWPVRRSVVFEPEFAQVQKATPHIWAWPKLTRTVTVIEVVVIVAAVVLINLSESL